MAKTDLRPEQIIRAYLERQEGPVEAHILHLKETFEVDELSRSNLSRIAKALHRANINVEPPLKGVPEDGRLTLTLANGRGAASQQADEPQTRERPIRRARFPRRIRRQPERPREQPVELSEEVVAARDALARALAGEPDAGDPKAALAALEQAARNPNEAAAAVKELLARFEAEAEQRLKESDGALADARGAREGLSSALGELDGGLQALVEREEYRDQALGAAAERRRRLAEEIEQKLAAAEGALQEEIAGQRRSAELNEHFEEVSAAGRRLASVHQSEDPKIASREQELNDAVARVTAARAAVEEALVDASAREQLEARVAALDEAERDEAAAREALDQARARLAAELQDTANGLGEAQERLGRALANDAHESQLRTRLEQLGSAQREALEASDDQLGLLMGKLAGERDVADELHRRAREARGLVEEADDAPGSTARLEAAIAANRAALEALRPIDKLIEARAESAAGGVERLEKAEQRVADLTARVEEDRGAPEQYEGDIEQLRAAAAKAEQERDQQASELEQRAGELEQARSTGEATERSRAELEQRVRDYESQVEAARSEAQAAGERLERQRQESEGRVATLSGELNKIRQELGGELADRDQQLQERATELKTTKTRLMKVEGAAKNVQARLVPAREEAELRVTELSRRLADAEQDLEDRGADLEGTRAQLQAANERATGDAEDARERVAALTSALEQRAGELEQSRSETESLRGEITEVGQQAKEKLDSLSQKLREIEAGLAERAAELSRVEAERAGAQEKVASLSEELAAARSQQDQSSRHIQGMRSELASAADREKELGERVGSLSKRLTHVGEVRDQALQRSAALELELERSRAEAESSGRELAARSESLERTQAELEAAREDARQANEQREQAVAQAQEATEQRDQAAQQAQHALARLGEVELEAQGLRETSKPKRDSGAEDEIAELSRRLADAEATLERRTEELHQARHVDADDGRVGQLEQRLADLEVELKRAQRQEKVARKQVDRFKRKLEESRAKGEAPVGPRQRAQEGQLLDAVDSVRRALFVGLDQPADAHPASQDKPKPKE